jgi:replicative DNA helicase
MAENIKAEFKNKKQSKTDISSMVYGKVPPQAIELEEAVLGAIMLEKDKLLEVFEIIKDAECFYKSEHKKIYKCIQAVYKKGFPIDLLTVTDHLRKTGELELVGGAYYLTKLTMDVVSSAHVEAHSRIIIEKFIKREQIRIAGELMSKGYDDTTEFDDGIDFGIKELSNLTNALHGKKIAEFAEIYDDVLMEMEQSKYEESETDIEGIPTGYREIDNWINGLCGTNVTVIAARPGSGKTAFMLNIAWNASFSTKCGFVLIFSLEMKKEDLVKRLMSKVADVDFDHVIKPKRQSKEESDLLMKTRNKIEGRNIFIEDSSRVTPLEVRAKVRRLHAMYGQGLIIIDYLQLMKPNSRDKHFNRDAEIGEISREIKGVAMDYDVPIIELSQMNREVEKRKGNVPQLSDLRESGAIEQDASNILFIYRPEDEDVAKDRSLEGVVKIVCAKSRNGSKGEAPLHFIGNRQSFKNYGEFDFVNQQMVVDNPSAGMANAFQNTYQTPTPTKADDLPF